MGREYDLVVIGSGAAASSAWSHARGLGKDVVVIEKDVLGGECPTFACVPTKSLLHSAEVYQAATNSEQFGVRGSSPRFDFSAIKQRKVLRTCRTMRRLSRIRLPKSC
jgi:dihydrolipoamide dehydrogenase